MQKKSMKFRTEIDIKAWQQPIGYDDCIMSLGSCFATNIASKLSERHFKVTSAPTGILFNPASIARALDLMTSGCTVAADSLIMVNDRYVNFDFHSSVSGATADEAVEVMNEALRRGGEALQRADMLIVTLGTAWVYRHVDSGAVVANCHKVPARMFRRELLSVEECVELLEHIVELAPRRLLFTVSPVRHVGEGLEDNALSKSLLRVAVDIVCRRHAHRVSYFPAYEILIDDLRDYRFYCEDMVHPTPQAVEYVAQKFFDAALSGEARGVMHRVEQIVAASRHRPTNPASEQHRTFCRRQLEAINSISGVDLSEERAIFEHMLQINL